jgi:hypothetical protein
MAPLREAKSRAGWKSINVWLPPNLHRALALARVHDGIATNEAVREAIVIWLDRRKAARRKRRAVR